MKLLNRLNPDINTIHPYKPGKPIEEVARELGLDPHGIIKLASNESPLGPSPKAVEAIKKQLPDLHRYPDGTAYLLRLKMAAKYGLNLEQIMLGNGSNEILELVGHCFLGRNSSVVYSSHSFAVYTIVAQLFGARIIEVPMKPGLLHDIDAMVAAITTDTTVVFICNPNNPTGTILNPGMLTAALKKIPEDVLIVIDEAYAEVCLEPMPPSLELLKTLPNLLICRTFSKAYGLAGLRIGYGFGAVAVVQTLQKARQPFNVNLLAQIAASAALDDDDFVIANHHAIRQGREYIEEQCRRLELNYIPTATNFMLIEVGDGKKTTQELMHQGVIVRSMEGYHLPQYLRVTFGTAGENKRFIAALKQVLER